MNWTWPSSPPITARSCRGPFELAQKQSEQLDAYLQALRNQLNSQRQREAEKALESTELLAENSENLPPDITAQFKVNRELSQALNQQAQRMDLVASQQRQATNQTLQVRQALNTLREQSQWLGSSNLLGEALRAQVARLPERLARSSWIPKWRSCACSVCALKIYSVSSRSCGRSVRPTANR
jgi:potassium efflux system protein